MPWNINGTFTRVNPDFSGNNVWQQDQGAGIKIIAARHDSHDEDLGQGIAKCINIDGYNSMLANFDVGNFKVVNMSPGTGGTDAVNKDQLDVVDAKADKNASDIAAIQTSDPDSIITAVNFDALDMNFLRASGNFVVPLRRFNDLKAGQIIRHIGADLTAQAVTTVDTQLGNRWYMYNNLTGTMDINFDRPAGADADLGENYFTEGMIIIENGGTPALPTIQADGVDVSPSEIIGSPTLNAGSRYTLSYSIQRIAGDVYRQAFIWSTP
jgi:hypothetical protein